jgi:hypothetical protein
MHGGTSFFGIDKASRIGDDHGAQCRHQQIAVFTGKGGKQNVGQLDIACIVRLCGE